nr:retrovirus-related Pol polyprotein from transposon TNT 1-94 [Tanacetum cinerariifolium]
MMSFLIAVVTLRYPPTNNQLRTSSNPHQQATINNGRVTIQPIQRRQNSLTAGMSRQYTSRPSGTNSRKQRVIVCYNYKGEGHMSKQCTKPKKKRDEAWFKDKVVLTKLSAEQAFWSQNSENSEEPNLFTNTTIVEVLKELPKVSMSQENDTIIMKLKERIKSLSGNVKEEKIKRELEEIETINIELDHRVTKLVAENEHLKQTYKQLYDSIKSLRVRSKEQCDDLIKQVNIKSAEHSDLHASLQEKVLVITALKDTLRKLKGKAVINEAVTLHPIDPELLKIDVAQLAPKLQNNRTAHND